MNRTPAADEKALALREVVPASGAGIYLDTAAMGPLPAETAAAMRDADDWELRVGRATEGRDADVTQRAAEARSVLAALVVGDPADIALMPGLGMALSVAASAPDWRPCDRLLIVRSIGPEALAAAHGVASRLDVVLDVVDGDHSSVDRLANSITPRTRLVLLPHVDAHDGRLLPVADVAARLSDTSAWLALDASLSAGAVEIDVSALGVDFVALPADRWLLGPESAAGLWIGPRPRADASPLSSSRGGYETLQADVGRMWPDARRFEPGGLPRSAILGLARSVGWLEMYVGLEWAYSRTARLAHRLQAALSALSGVEVITPADAMGAVVCFRVAGWSTVEVADELRRRVFAIIGSTPDEAAVRASVAWFNTDEELDRFAAAVGLIAEHTPATLPRRPPIIVQ